MTQFAAELPDNSTKQNRPTGWLDGTTFDLTFLVGTVAVALASLTIVLARPSLFRIVLLADVWLLGYHHVISTYTKLAPDAEARHANRALLTWVPLVVIASVALVGYGVGLWALTTIYLYWQWWHYSRQSWGVHRVYQRKGSNLEDDRLSKAAFYAIPIWGILHRSAQDPDSFLGVDVEVLPVPSIVAHAVGLVAIGVLAAHGYRLFAAWRRGDLSIAHATYLISHNLMFFVGYILIPNIDLGWLAINIWHNAQYIGFVWYFNHRRHASDTGDAGQTSVVAKLSRRRNPLPYLVACFLLSSVIYLAIDSTIAATVAPIIVYQAINFHHYVVDSLIWKVRKAPLQQTLGISR